MQQFEVSFESGPTVMKFEDVKQILRLSSRIDVESPCPPSEKQSQPTVLVSHPGIYNDLPNSNQENVSVHRHFLRYIPILCLILEGILRVMAAIVPLQAIVRTR